MLYDLEQDYHSPAFVEDAPAPIYYGGLTPRQMADRIARRVLLGTDYTVADMKLTTRGTLPVAHARQAVMAAIRDELDWAYERIGRYLGNRDHSTIVYGVKRHKEKLKKDMENEKKK